MDDMYMKPITHASKIKSQTCNCRCGQTTEGSDLEEKCTYAMNKPKIPNLIPNILRIRKHLKVNTDARGYFRKIIQDT